MVYGQHKLDSVEASQLDRYLRGDMGTRSKELGEIIGINMIKIYSMYLWNSQIINTFSKIMLKILQFGGKPRTKQI